MNDERREDTMAERVRGALNGLIRKDVSSFVELFADDGVLEFPFALPGFARRVEGKTGIAEYMKVFPERLEISRIVRFEPHPVVGDGRVVIEFACEGRVLSTGRPYNQSYVSVIVHENGLVKSYRDYWNPLVVLEAMGGPDAVKSFAQAER